jgi:hypothetical protein
MIARFWTRCGYGELVLEIEIGDIRLSYIWARVWCRMPEKVQLELNTALAGINDVLHPCAEIEFGCAHYSISGSIRLYAGDLCRLSDSAIEWVIAHELGHAYCHLKCGNPSPCGPDIDTGANLVASAWGFEQERLKFEKEKRIIMGS